VAAGCDDVFKGAIEIGDLVKGAVKGDFHGRGEFHQGACARRVNRAICIQNAEDDAGRSEALRVLQLGADGGEVGCGVDEAVSVRAQQHVNRKAAAMYGLLEEFVAGCKATNAECGTEFDAVRATGPGRQAGFKGFGA